MIVLSKKHSEQFVAAIQDVLTDDNEIAEEQLRARLAASWDLAKWYRKT